jgi:hypothetical protein
MINILHVQNAALIEETNSFINNNISNISILKVDSYSILKELDRLQIIKLEHPLNSLIYCRKITNEIFNNAHTKAKAPIVTPDFCFELVNYLVSKEIDLLDSWLVNAYHWSIPIFIRDAGSANYVFGGNFNANCPLLSSEADWYYFNEITNREKANFVYTIFDDYVLRQFPEFVASIGMGFPNYKIIKNEEYLPEIDKTSQYLYE